jgi:hypothetical protein
MRRVAVLAVLLVVSSLAYALAACRTTASVKAPPPIPPDNEVGVSDVVTHHNDNARSGVTTTESRLTLKSVNPTTFGKVFQFPVDGYVYAEPLFVANLTMQDGYVYDVLFVATEHDSVYAFDATGNVQTPLWKVSLLGPGEVTVLPSDVSTNDIVPEIGITGTPVIDRNRGMLYVVSQSKSTSANSDAGTGFFQRFHALRLADGSEAQNGPVLVSASAPGTAIDADSSGMIHFNAQQNNQRAALAEVQDTIWIAWGDHGFSTNNYHGWLLGYDAGNITHQTNVFASTHDTTMGGIWMGAGGPSTDGNGNIFVNAATGNFDAADGGEDYAMSALKLGIVDGGLSINDWFSPFNEAALSSVDSDFGTIADLILPDQPGSVPHLLVTGGKDGTLYLVNRDAMGHFDDSTNNIVETWPSGGNRLLLNPAFYNGTLYVGATDSPLQAFPFEQDSGKFAIEASSLSPELFTCTKCFVSGSSPVVSVNGTTDAIVWALDNGAYNAKGPAILHAYDATNLENELYSSDSAPNNRDQAAGCVKFTSPTIANGRVYVGGVSAVTVYGLLGDSHPD